MTLDSEETGTFQTYLAHGYTRSHVTCVAHVVPCPYMLFARSTLYSL